MDTLPSAVRVWIARFLTRADVISWLLYAVESGDEELVRLLMYEMPYPVAHCRSLIVHTAASKGYWRALAAFLAFPRRWAWNHTSAHRYVSSQWSRGFPAWVLFDAIEKMDDETVALTTVQWLHPRTKYKPTRAIEMAARCRRLVLAQWLATVAVAESVRIHIVVPFDETIPVLHWVEITSVGNDSSVFRRSWLASRTHGVAPVRSGHCYDETPLFVYPAIDFAAQVGDFELLQALHHDTRIAWGSSTEAMDAAAARGDLVMVQWLHEHRTDGCSPTAMDQAATNGHLEVVKWLYFIRNQRGTKRAFDGAASNGHVSTLQWQSARFPHFQLSTYALETAAAKGHLQVLQWVMETTSRVSVTPSMMQNAINNGHVEVVQWLADVERTKGYDPRRYMPSYLLARAAEGGNLAFLQWLKREFDVVSSGWLPSAAVNADKTIVQWLVTQSGLASHELHLGTATLYQLARRGEWKTLEWLLISYNDLCLECQFLPPKILHTSIQFPRENDSWLPRYVRLVLKYVPIITDSHKRLVEWAARHALDDILDQVWTRRQGRRPDKRVLGTVIRHMATTTASRVVETMVKTHPEWISHRVIQWAATFAHVPLLDTMVMLVPSTQHVAFLRTTLFTACRHGQREIVIWVRHQHLQLDSLPSHIDLWRNAIRHATHHHQHHIVEYLHSNS